MKQDRLISFIKTWISVARLPSALLALSSVTMGSALAVWEGKWNGWVSILAAFTAIFLQSLANLANDYGDFLHGASVGNRVGTRKAGKKALVSLRQAKRAIAWLVLLSLVCGLALLKVACLPSIAFFFFGLLGGIAIAAAITYTMGPHPYGYAGWGDVAVFLFFGLLGVVGTTYLHTQAWHWGYVLPACSCGCLAVAVLNLNNLRDRQQDAQVGKKTLVVRIGRKAGLYYQWALLLGSIVAAMIFTMTHHASRWQWLFVGAIPRLIQNGIMTMRLAPNQLDPVLQRLVLAQLFFVLLFSIGLVLSAIVCKAL